MSAHTTLRIGGPADYFAEPDNEEDLIALVLWARRRGLPFRVIGSGANLLVSDAGVRGLVIQNRNCRGSLQARTGTLYVGSGVQLADAASYCAGRGWSGLEWAVGIPGTVAGAIVGNAGAFGGYIGNVVRSVTVLDQAGQVTQFSAGDCGFVYRGSRFKGQWPQHLVLLGAALTLTRQDVAAIQRTIAEYVTRREAAQPWEPSAGSVFKRTAAHPAGWLIEQVGLKGQRVGDAQISPKHANFIVNLGQATAGDVLALITMAQRAVRERFGVDLELELEQVS
jgi:UDP-N-acetylmuramate dehydrogenase